MPELARYVRKDQSYPWQFLSHNFTSLFTHPKWAPCSGQGLYLMNAAENTPWMGHWAMTGHHTFPHHKRGAFDDTFMSMIGRRKFENLEETHRDMENTWNSTQAGTRAQDQTGDSVAVILHHHAASKYIYICRCPYG